MSRYGIVLGRGSTPSEYVDCGTQMKLNAVTGRYFTKGARNKKRMSSDLTIKKGYHLMCDKMILVVN